MAKKSKSNSKSETNRRFDRRAAELTSAKLGQLLRGKDFGSLEDANKFLMENANGLKHLDVEYEPENALAQAQYIMWQAFDEKSSRKRIAMAKEALNISLDCADAYVLLAEDEARDAKQEIEYYRQGVAAGRRALSDIWDSPDVPFWSDLKTRPYMRAVDGLASALRRTGEIGEAIDLWKELLRLNSNDNLGVRLMLVPTLVGADRLDEAETLLNHYDEDSAHMRYSRALCIFKKHGDGTLAHDALQEAISVNRYVLEILLGISKMLTSDYSSFTPGSHEEADDYLCVSIDSWTGTEGALDWITEFMLRKMQKRQLLKTFPGLQIEIAPSNVVPFNMSKRV
jgi:tetratricopeptide (TPR) repeat protein